MISGPQFQPGDPVVFRKTKWSASPGPRAEQVDPEPRGEEYHYVVDKYWVVADVQDDGQLVLRTRRGKTHVIRADHPALRRPSWLQRLLHARRFPRLQDLPPIGQVLPRDKP